MSRHPIGTAITTLAVTTIAIGPTTIPIVRQMGEAVPEAIQETDPIGHQTRGAIPEAIQETDPIGHQTPE